jgi:putative transposase
MKKRPSSEEEDHIVSALKDANVGAKIEEFCRQNGISTEVLANWLAQHEALMPSETRRMKQLEEENRRLRTLVADLTLSNQTLKLAVSKKM